MIQVDNLSIFKKKKMFNSLSMKSTLCFSRSHSQTNTHTYTV